MNSGRSIRDLPIRTGSSIDNKRSPLITASKRRPHNMAVVANAAQASVLTSGHFRRAPRGTPAR